MSCFVEMAVKHNWTAKRRSHNCCSHTRKHQKKKLAKIPV